MRSKAPYHLIPSDGGVNFVWQQEQSASVEAQALAQKRSLANLRPGRQWLRKGLVVNGAPDFAFQFAGVDPVSLRLSSDPGLFTRGSRIGEGCEDMGSDG